MLEVFVKSCELTITPAQTKPDSRPNGTICKPLKLVRGKQYVNKQPCIIVQKGRYKRENGA